MQPFAHNLAFLIDRLRLDRRALVNRLGVGMNDLQAWSEGRAEPGLQQLIQLSAMLKVSVDRLLKNDLQRRAGAEDIKLLVLDVDGVLTDGGIYLTERGDEIKKFHARDGRGIVTAQKVGVEVAFLSGGRFPEAINLRAERLGIRRCYVGTEPKTAVLERWMAESGLTYKQVAHIGDDANDLDVLSRVGLSACPADAAPKNREVVDIILNLPGGQGCVREFIEEHLGIEVD
ncbi:MAG: HAD-IIIA family hydrolase [Bacteroidia bacterium]